MPGDDAYWAEQRQQMATLEAVLPGDGLVARARTVLRRRGLLTEAQIAACPDETLLALRNIGAATLAAIRRRVPYRPDGGVRGADAGASYPQPQSGDDFDGGLGEGSALLARCQAPFGSEWRASMYHDGRGLQHRPRFEAPPTRRSTAAERARLLALTDEADALMTRLRSRVVWGSQFDRKAARVCGKAATRLLRRIWLGRQPYLGEG